MDRDEPDIEKLKKSVYDGLMSLVDDGELGTEDVVPMLQAFGNLPADEQTAGRFERMIEAARKRRKRRPRWRAERRE
ncbi:MAG: hypothetical protein ACLFV7_14590 [Phycisphaerae bacterium]